MTEDQIIERLVGREGAFVNRRADRGGPTKWGVTMPTLRRYRGRPVTIEDIRVLARVEAAALYRELFIHRPGFRALSSAPVLFELVVDCGVHHGTERATRWLQTALGGLLVDGQLGPKTRAAILERGSVRELYRKILGTRTRFVGRIITDDRPQAEFAAGWNARLAEFVELTP